MSACLKPGQLNSYAVKVIEEIGLDISLNRTKGVFALYKKGMLFSYVISVCDAANAERCPTFPGQTTGIDWSFEDPSKLTVSGVDKLQAFRIIREQIYKQLLAWLKTV